MTATLTGGTTYTIYINLYDDHGFATPQPYRVILSRTS